ncbi:ATP-binding protein [Streptomyces sp. NPDC002788]
MASVIPSAPLGTDAAEGLPGLGAGAASLGAAAERRFRFELAAHPGSPAQARRLTRARLTGWSVCEDTCDSAALVVSELVTNAIVHTASTHIVCELHDGEDLVRIAVRDEGCAPGQPDAAGRTRPEDEHGRGLLLVDALCHAWGAHEHGPGLLVWAELPRKADTPRDPAETWNDLGWKGHGENRVRDEPGRDGPDHHRAAPVRGEPRNDLGWGTRPKRGSADDSGGGDGTAAHATRHTHRAPEVPSQERRTERGPA